MLKKRLNAKTRGFTLVELLVVIAIIAILSVTAYVALGGQTAKARNSRRMSDLSTIQSALEIYFISNSNAYPETLDELVPAQINKIPTDPTTDGDYSYAFGPANRSFQLAAHLEDEDGGLADKAYLIGNGEGLIDDGCNYNGSTGVCDGSCTVTVDSLVCMPYGF